MLEGKARVVVQMGKDGRIRHVLVYLPTDVARDSAFPLSAGDARVVIQGRKVVVEQ